jgi:serine/threonine-protein kinase
MPFAASNAYAVMDAILRAEPPPLRDIRSDVPEALAVIVSRTLQKRREDRYQEAHDVLLDLQSVAGVVATLPASLPVVSKPARTPPGPPIRRPSSPSIAVLPFANLSSNLDNEYFSDGLTDELINALSQLRGLKVVSRTSSFEFKNKALNVRRIGEQLGVSALLEGSVRRSGERLRITAQLVNVEDACQIWAGRFDRKITDVFAIQDEIAQTIANRLAITLGSREGRPLVKRYTNDLEAYHLYLKGRFQWHKRSGEGFAKALEYFQEALAHDPGYAPAYSGLADYYMSVAAWGLSPPTQAWAEAKRMALKALEADPTLAEAHTSLAVYLGYAEWNWDEAEREFLSAQQLNPNDTNTCFLYATYLIQRGRLHEARVEMERAFELNPLSATINTYLAGVAHYSRGYDESIRLCQKTLEIAPDDVEVLCVLALNFEQTGRLPEALATFERALELSERHPLVLGSMGATCARAGQLDRHRAIHDELLAMGSERYVPPIALAWIHIASAELDRAFDYLEEAAQARDCLLCYLGVGPVYDSLRQHPRYLPLMQQIGLASRDDTANGARTG